MSYKWIGGILVIVGCGSVGFSVASNYRRQERLLRQLLHILEIMKWELQFKLTPLPQLCRMAAKEGWEVLREIFRNLAAELDAQSAPDVCCCMSAALGKTSGVPYSLRRQLLRLGNSLGRFDLPGQLQGLRSVEKGCREELQKLNQNAEERSRTYQTLGLCAGAALAILLV